MARSRFRGQEKKEGGLDPGLVDGVQDEALRELHEERRAGGLRLQGHDLGCLIRKLRLRVDKMDHFSAANLPFFRANFRINSKKFWKFLQNALPSGY